MKRPLNWIIEFKNLLRVAGITHPYNVSAALHIATHTLKPRVSPRNAVFYVAMVTTDRPDPHIDALAIFLFQKAITGRKEEL